MAERTMRVHARGGRPKLGGPDHVHYYTPLDNQPVIQPGQPVYLYCACGDVISARPRIVEPPVPEWTPNGPPAKEPTR
jgi:hypothetical protein